MQVRYVDTAGVHDHDSADLDMLLAREDGLLWADAPSWDDDVEKLLHRLGCHPRVIDACRQRNHVPTVHAYEGHYFLTLHTPLLGEAGHVHLLELDQVVGDRVLVTVHGPLNPAVDPTAALVETDSVLTRVREGRLLPTSAAEISYAIGSAVARSQRGLVGLVAERLPGLEQEVMGAQLREPEAMLERMFLIRHELITARTMAAQTHDVYGRLASLERSVAPEHRELAHDLADQFDRVRSVADGEAQFLFGVTELYQTKVNTKMTVAMERLAVIAAITLPVTAIASVLGMNVIVRESTEWVALASVLAVMGAVSFLLLRWAKRQGWW